MKLLRIEFDNFRVFRGRQTIEFSTDPQRPVTLVHALNGSGKTTLLNAILWTFYGTTTPTFSNPREVATYGTDRAIVRVRFEHDGSSYEAERLSAAPGTSTLRLFSIEDGGVRKELSAPELFLNSVLPKAMAGYFFVDGENAKRFGLAAKRQEIAVAIRNMLGFSLAENALADLTQVYEDMRRRVGQLPGAGRAAEISDKIDAQERLLKAKVAEHEQQMLARTQHEASITELESQLRQQEASKQLQELRDQLRASVNKDRLELAEACADRRKMVATLAPALFAEKLSQRAIDAAEALRTKGRVPAPYNRVFVEDLMESGICVCGRPLVPGDEAWGHVHALLGDADDGFVQERLTKAQTQAAALARAASSAAAMFDKVEARIGRIQASLRDNEQRLAEADRKMKAVDIASIAETERKRRSLQSSHRAISTNIGRLAAEVQACRNEIAKLRRELNEIVAQNEKLAHFQAPMQVAEEARDFLKEELSRYEIDAIESVRRIVSTELQRVVQKDFVFEMSSEYEVKWIRGEGSDSVEAAPSMGEGILLGLIFIAGLCKFSAERVNDDAQLLTPGTVAPMVLDAPLGQLDRGYQRAIATLVPQLAEQVVFLLTDSQSQAVLDTLRPKIGKEYVAMNRSRASSNAEKADVLTINVNGKDYSLRLLNEDDEYTELVEAEA